MADKKKKEDTLQSVPRRVVENEPGSDQPGHNKDPEPFVDDETPKQPLRSMPQMPEASPAIPPKE